MSEEEDIDQSTINEQPSTENMKVHHHPQVEKKNFKEYFLEFLMIFLAVTMGFFAENIRENSTEQHKEKGYMISMINDLQSDISGANRVIKYNFSQNNLADSIFHFFELSNSSHNSDLYYAARKFSFLNFLYPNDGTVEQLRNAGGLSLIKKTNVVDSIQSYINLVRVIIKLQELEESELVDYRSTESALFDAMVFNKMYQSNSRLLIQKVEGNPPLISWDKKTINDLNMKIVIVKGNMLSQINNFNHLVNSAQALISLIEKEYNL